MMETAGTMLSLTRSGSTACTAIVRAIPKLSQAEHWILNILGSAKKMEEFLKKHSEPGTWTDDSGIICLATALIVGREIKIVGTANISSLAPDTLLWRVWKEQTRRSR